MNEKLEVFCCYARKDLPLLLKLRTHMTFLEREGPLNIWCDMNISPGTEWEEAISKHLNTSHIILLLISPDFMASEYCYSKEMKQAMGRHERGEVRIIPILLRPSIWQDAPFAKLQMLPNNARAVTEWRNRDQALLTIAQGVEQVAKDQLTKLSMTSFEQSQSTIDTTRLHLKNITGTVRSDWGEAPDVPLFFGRTKELISLEKWITEDRCRLVALVGMKGIGKTKLSLKLGRGGIGKTDLSIKLARGIQEQFDYVIWRRLLNAPKVSEILADLIKFLSEQQEVHMAGTVGEQISRLLYYLRRSRCLIILDNIEMILQGGKYVGQYSPGYEEYGQLFEQIAEVAHQSCLLLTSREKPPEIARFESQTGFVRSLEVRGLHYLDSKKIFGQIGTFSASKEEWKQLNWLYNGNPLALELAARHIKEVFFGNISEFLRDGKPIFADLQGLLDWHFNRLSDAHKEIMYWFALNREPTPLSALREDILSPTGKEQVSSTLHTLQRLIPLEKSASSFTLQPVLIEYMTERFIEYIVKEIQNRELRLFNTHSLLKASSANYVREAQNRIILKSVGEKLLEASENRENLGGKLKETLSLLRERLRFTPGYAGGNLLNLLCYLKMDLRGYDFFSLAIWQAYLQGVNLPEVNFTQADLARSVFSDTFGSTLAVTISSNGNLLAAGTADGEIRLWNLLNETPLLTWQGHFDWIRSIAFSPDGQLLVSGSDDETIGIWETNTGKCLHTLGGHSSWVRSVTFSPDGAMVVSGGDDGRVLLWEVKTGYCLATLLEHTKGIWTTTFSPDGQLLATGGYDQVVKLWEVSTKRCLTTLLHTDDIWAIAFSPDGQFLATGSSTHIKLWNIKQEQVFLALEGHTHSIRSVAFSPDGQLLASGSEDRTIRLWEISTGRCLHTLQGHGSRVWSMAFSPSGSIIASCSDDHTIRLWEVNTGHCLTILQGHTNEVWAVAFSPDGRFLASGGDDQIVRLWEIGTQQCLITLPGHTNWIRTVAFSPDGHYIASGSDDQMVRIWEVATGKCLHILREHNGWISSVAFSPDEQFLASGGSDQTIKIWEISTGHCVLTLKGHSIGYALAFSPDGESLVSSGPDHNLCLWHTRTGQRVATLPGHTNWVWSVIFSPDGHLIASGGDDHTLRVWEVSTGKCLHTIDHTHGVWSVSFSPDGHLIAAGSTDHNIRVWETITGKYVYTLQGHKSWIWSVSFSPDGRFIATGSVDGTVKLWNVPDGSYSHTLRPERPYEGMNITGIRGLSEAQKSMLKVLGAFEQKETEEREINHPFS